MVKYDFDKLTERRGTNSYKWDVLDDADVLPMWVADMDFEVAPAITKALQERVAQGIFGYTKVPDSYYEAIVGWFKRRHDWTIECDWILYTTGVVPAVSCTLKALTLPGEKVLLQTPAYNCFFSSIANSGCQLAENELIYENGTYHIDFDDFERKCADEKTTVFLLCNPHNPAGRVWKREELERMNAICLKHGVKVVSDEIHCELVMPGFRFVPFASVSDACRDNCVVLNSPSKSFNIAGLQIANVICADAAVRRRIERAININEVCDVNPFGVLALQAAYNEGGEWLDQLNAYIHGNYELVKEFVATEMPKLKVVRMEGTYLIWLDVLGLEFTSDELTAKLLKEAKVMVNSGTMYGQRAGQGFIRLNIACPRARLLEALKRMGRCLAEYMIDEAHGCPL